MSRLCPSLEHLLTWVGFLLHFGNEETNMGKHPTEQIRS